MLPLGALLFLSCAFCFFITWKYICLYKFTGRSWNIIVISRFIGRCSCLMLIPLTEWNVVVESLVGQILVRNCNRIQSVAMGCYLVSFSNATMGFEIHLTVFHSQMSTLVVHKCQLQRGLYISQQCSMSYLRHTLSRDKKWLRSYIIVRNIYDVSWNYIWITRASSSVAFKILQV